MKKFLVIESKIVLETCTYVVEADNLDEAIKKSVNMEPVDVQKKLDETTYKDSFEITDEEFEKLTNN
jgi:hypothetical protein